VDLGAERRHGDFVRELILAGRVGACHDISDGGLLVAVAEMALAGDIGAEVTPPADWDKRLLPDWLYGEDQGRYLLATADADAVLAAAEKAKVPAAVVGTTGGGAIRLLGKETALAELRRAREGWFPDYMSAGA
jgi:phosphoribosylformylglycinamidine synthase